MPKLMLSSATSMTWYFDVYWPDATCGEFTSPPIYSVESKRVQAASNPIFDAPVVRRRDPAGLRRRPGVGSPWRASLPSLDCRRAGGILTDGVHDSQCDRRSRRSGTVRGAERLARPSNCPTAPHVDESRRHGGVTGWRRDARPVRDESQAA
jgi:hypothetical protein